MIRTCRIAGIACALVCAATASDAWARGDSPRARRSCPVTEYGAVGDGRTLNTRAIQAAIDGCSEQGGGTVVVAQGTFLSGALFLRRGVSLRIDRDGVLKGSTNPADYPQVPTRWEGVEREWMAALVNAVGLADFELSGEGTLDGAGTEWTQRYPRARLVCLQDGHRIRVRGLRIRDQASWALHVLYSEDVVIEDVVIRAAHDLPSSDGIDVDSSRNVRIRRVDIDVNDDCISIKSGKDADGLRVARPSEDVVIEHSRFGYGHGGVAMGSETSGGIRDVTVRDCVFEAGNWAPIRFKSQPSRGGVVERITYRDLVLRDVRRAFEFDMEWRMVPPIAPPAAVLPVVRDVRIVNVTGQARSAGLLHGLALSPIRGVRFDGCRLATQTGLVLENVEEVDLSGLALEVAEGPAVTRRTGEPATGRRE